MDKKMEECDVLEKMGGSIYLSIGGSILVSAIEKGGFNSDEKKAGKQRSPAFFKR